MQEAFIAITYFKRAFQDCIYTANSTPQIIWLVRTSGLTFTFILRWSCLTHVPCCCYFLLLGKILFKSQVNLNTEYWGSEREKARFDEYKRQRLSLPPWCRLGWLLPSSVNEMSWARSGSVDWGGPRNCFELHGIYRH